MHHGLTLLRFGHHRTSAALSRCLGCGVALALWWLVGGCATTESREFQALTSVRIEDKTVDEVGIATVEVFIKAGFEAHDVTRGKLTFTRSGSTLDAVLYGGWAGGKMTERVKVHITSINAITQLVELEAFKVRDAGDQVFEESRRIRRRGSYDALLQQVVARLK